MPSPFPGMDPYLEDPDVFPGLHDQLIVHLAEYLQARMPEPYFAKPAQRTWIEWVERPRVPDVSVLIATSKQVGSTRDTGGVAVADIADNPVTITVEDLAWDERRETLVEVYSNKDGRKRLVTSIEILSPSNKTRGDDAHETYQRKQREILSAEVNLVEIDLLRQGEHVTAVPKDLLFERCGVIDYHVCIHRFDRYRDFDVYAVQLPERLPQIAIPLLAADPTVAVDLQEILDHCYDAGPYRREVDYSVPPPRPALSPERLAWVKRVLAETSTGPRTN